MHRRRLVGALLSSAGLLMPRFVAAAIAPPDAASRRVRHRLTDAQLDALAGHRLTTLDAKSPLHADLRRLLGTRHAVFMTSLGSELPMRREGDVIAGEGARHERLGHDASFFALAHGGAMFAVIKGGAFGIDIAQFGDPSAMTDARVKHRYLEFTDLDE